MFRKFILSLGMLAISTAANASLIVSQSDITGADMAGIEVTVTFEDSSTESSIWAIIADNGGVSIEDAEGRVGGAIASTWSLTQQGYTFGNSTGSGAIYGLWTFANNNALGVTNISISGLLSGLTSIAFDIVQTSTSDEAFPGSGNGRPFQSSLLSGATGSYANQADPAYNDLFYTLNIDLSSPLAQGESFNFLADTEEVSVSEPGTLAILLSCGMLLVTRRFSRTLSK